MNGMNRREIFQLSGATALAVGMSGCTGAAVKSAASCEKPNIVVCMTDDQGWGDMGYYGLKQIKTPNLDAMAAAGVQFNRFYAQPSSSPTRACAMTGRHPNRMGVFWPGMPLRKQEVTVARSMKLAGYATGHFGKWHLNGVAGPGKVIPDSDPLSPRNVGFDESFSVSNFFDYDWTFGSNGVPVKTTGDGSDVIVAQALKFIERNAKLGKPVVAFIWFGSPHSPHRPLPEDLKAAGGSAYYGEMIGVDRSMGALRSGLRKLGIADNTMVWYSSDNGGWPNAKDPANGGSNGPFRGRKGDMWEGGIRVPGIIEWPARIKKPFVTEVPVGVFDIYPTLTAVADVKDPDKVGPVDGINILPILDGQMKERPRPMGFWQYDESQSSINTNSGPSAWNDNRYKLVKTKPETWELYDITTDPSETKDVSAAHPDILSRMKAELNDWQLSVIRSYNGEDYKTRNSAEH